ncbi:MAG: GNAT family N-acetyltransferase [Paludibacteraceae bacterium]|nr:GNAT family N-acetyltransferase [Paludibacteraceae bacterium]
MIRNAQEKDINKISNLLGQVLLVHHNMRPDIFKKEGAKYTEEQLREIINNPLTPTFVYIDENDNVLGHIFTQIIHNKESSNTNLYTTLYIDDICIDANHRHQAIGSSLVNHVKQFAMTIGVHNITANVWEGNSSSMAMFKKAEFKPLKTTLEIILD